MKNVKRILKRLLGLVIILISFPFEILGASIVAVFKKGRVWLTKRIRKCENYIEMVEIRFVLDIFDKVNLTLVKFIIKFDKWIIELNEILEEGTN